MHYTRSNLIVCYLLLFPILLFTPFSVKALAVDPDPQAEVPAALIASTFLGGSGYDSGWPTSNFIRDPEGNIYITGYTRSSNFPVTQGAFDTDHNGQDDIFVAKLDSGLTTLLACTYLGGSGNDRGLSIHLDDQGRVYLAGETGSTDFPTTAGAYDDSHNGGKDLFIARFDAGLTALQCATYIGGSVRDLMESIVLKPTGEVFVTGTTNSDDFPVTPGAYDESYNGQNSSGYGDAYIARFDVDLTTLEACTYLGGESGEVHAFSILDPGYGILVGGSTDSSDFPSTPGAYQENPNGDMDAFLTRVGFDLSMVTESTLLGGTGRDWIYSLVLDVAGDVYVAGHADEGYPTTPGAYDTTYNGGNPGGDFSVSIMNHALSDLRASTFLGGSNDECAFSIDLDEEGRVYISGFSKSGDFPVTPGAFDATHNGDFDAVVAVFDNRLESLEACTFMGGNLVDRDVMIRVAGAGDVFLSGNTRSLIFPTCSDAWAPEYNGGGRDVFLSRVRVVSLFADRDDLSSTTGGTMHFKLASDAKNANRYYLLLGSMSGSEPAYPLPGDKALLPLHWDVFTDFALAWTNTPLMDDFFGTLDGNGEANATLHTGPLPSVAVGETLTFAFTLNRPFDFVSNPRTIDIIP